MSDSGKLSLYKHASPLERRSLVQGKLQHVPSPLVKTPLPLGREDQSVSVEDASGGDPSAWEGKTTPITTPTNVTELWSYGMPEVQVIRHTPPREIPQTVASGGSRFSSDFVQFQPPSAAAEVQVSELTSPTLLPPAAGDWERGGGEEEVEREGNLNGSDGTVSTSQPTPQPNTSQPPAQTDPVQSISGSVAEESSSHVQKKKPRKGKGRVIPSRYMSTVKPAPSDGHKTLPAKPSTTLNRTQASKKLTKSAQKQSKPGEDSFKKPSSLPRAKSVMSHPPPSLSSTLPHHPFTPSALTSSTPKIGSSQDSQSGAVLQDSFMDLSNTSSARTTTKNKLALPGIPYIGRRKPERFPQSKAVSSSSQSTDLESELLYCRLLQTTYLDVKSAKALREQEEKAKAQLHALWEEVEGRRRECAALRRDLETARRTVALSALLDAQVKELSPVISKLPQLQQYHLALSHSLDTTRHELPTSGLLPVTEQQLEAELTQSENLLTDILTSIRHNIPTVTSFADSTEAAVATLDKEFQELEKCWKELSSAVRLQVQETSLTFERKQRQRTLNPTPPHLFTNTCTE